MVQFLRAGTGALGRHRASVPGTESSHKFTLFTPPACARRRNVHQSCRYSQVHTQPTFANYRGGAPGTFPQVILTRTPTFHGLAINAVTNESAKTPPRSASWLPSKPYAAKKTSGWTLPRTR